MRSPLLVVALTLLFVPRVAEGAETDPTGLVLFTAASIDTISFIVGGILLGTSRNNNDLGNAGWLTIQAGLTLSPLAAHGVVGEWGRGAAFAALPASTLGGTAAVFVVKPDGIVSGSLPEQRLLWGLFSGGLIASTAGVIDAMLAPNREHGVGIAVLPAIGTNQVGLRIEGDL
jgi:hypothetical protein